MRKTEKRALHRALLHQRHVLLKEVADTEADLVALENARDSELEEAAQDDRTIRLLDRLDHRAKGEVEAIDRALVRLAIDTYGVCTECSEPIALARLRAVPATPVCIDCAATAERSGRLVSAVEVEVVPPRAALPPELALLNDRELQTTVREQLSADDRLDLDQLRIVCRHGTVYVDGLVPSATERQILLHTLNDVIGLTAVVDSVRVEPTPWEREPKRPRQVAESAPIPWQEPPTTDDIIEATEDGTEYDAPNRPPPDEE